MADFVVQGVAGAQHENGNTRIFAADLTQNFRAVQAGQHQIENDDVIVVCCRQFKPACSVRGRVDRVPFLGQTASNETRNLGFVLNQENAHSDTLYRI